MMSLATDSARPAFLRAQALTEGRSSDGEPKTRRMVFQIRRRTWDVSRWSN